MSAAQVCLEGRVARCYCGKIVESDSKLPFFDLGGFEASAPAELLQERNRILSTRKDLDKLPALNAEIRKLSTVDSFYCGCRGWD